MGVPIGDVARVSQVLLASLQQDRTTTEDRTSPNLISSGALNTSNVQTNALTVSSNASVSGTLSANQASVSGTLNATQASVSGTLNATQVITSGDIESSGLVKGDGGLLSNISKNLQEITDVGSITNHTITNTNKTRSFFNYSQGIINDLLIPKGIVYWNPAIDTSLSGVTAFAADSSYRSFVILFANFFRTITLDQNGIELDPLFPPFDVSENVTYGSYAKMSRNGLRLLLRESNGAVRFYDRGSNTSTEWTLRFTIYENSEGIPVNNNIGFGSSIDADDDLNAVAVGCPDWNDVTTVGGQTWVVNRQRIGVIKIYGLYNGGTFLRNINSPIYTSYSYFGSRVGVSRDGSKLIAYINQSNIRTYVFDFNNGSLIHTIDRQSEDSMRISNDGTIAILNGNVHKFLNSVWNYEILSGASDITSSGTIIKFSGETLLKYSYNTSGTLIGDTIYSSQNFGTVLHIRDDELKFFSSVDNKPVVHDILYGSSTKLSVDGSVTAEYLDVVGNVNISGTLTKGSGTFKIDHPLPNMESTHSLTHSFIEGPKADLVYRGKTQLENGSVIVNIDEVSNMTDGTFEALTRDTQCFVSNETNWDAVRGVVDGNSITIHSQNTTSNSVVSWLVIGERKDKHMYTLDWTDNDGRVVPEKLKM